MSPFEPARLILDDGPEIELTPARRADAAAAIPRTDRLEAGAEIAGWQLADRLDLLGHTAERAYAALDEELEVAQAALDTLPAAARQQHSWSLDPFQAGPVDAERWLQLFAAAHSAVYRGRLLELVAECPLPLLLRACLLARPRTLVRLRGDLPLPEPPPEPRLVLVGSPREAVLLRTRLTTDHPHLSDLVRIAPIRMDPAPDPRELLHALGVGSADAEIVGGERGTQPVD